MALERRPFHRFGEPFRPYEDPFLALVRELKSPIIHPPECGSERERYTYSQPSDFYDKLQEAQERLSDLGVKRRFWEDQLSIANPEFKGFQDYLKDQVKFLYKCELKLLEGLEPELRENFADRIEELRKKLRE